MALPPVGSTRTPVAAPTQNSAPTYPVKLGVTGESKPEEMTAGLQKLGLPPESAQAYAGQIAGIQSKASRTAALGKVEAKVNEFLKANPGASKEQVADFAKKQLMTQTIMYKHVEKSVMDMAQKSIERIRDTFSDS